MIIEDEFLTAIDIEGLLSGEGASSFAFAHTEAEALAEAHRATPDVIVSDVTLRDGSGLDAVAAIREDLGPLPVIFVTATPEVCGSCNPPVEIIGKPFGGEDVAMAFRRLSLLA